MEFPDRKKVEALKKVFGRYPDGATISALAVRTKMNRNLIAKYLQLLVSSGFLEMKSVGSARVYSISNRVPVQALIDYSSDLIVLLDTDNRITRINMPFFQQAGENQEQLTGEMIQEVTHPLLQALAQKVLPDIKQHEFGKRLGITLTIQNEPHSFNLHIIAIVFDDGSPGTALVLHDITADRKYQQMCTANETREKDLMEDQTEFVIRFLPDGSLSYMNKAFCQFFRKTRSECSGRSLWSIIPLEDQRVLEEALGKFSNAGPVVTVPWHIVGPAGKVRFQEWTIRALFNADGRIHEYQGVGRDITDIRDARRQINGYIADQAFLYKKSSQFLDLPVNASIYRTIGNDLREIYPDAVVAVNQMNPEGKSVTCRCFLGAKERTVFNRFAGEDMEGIVVPAPSTSDLDLAMKELLSGKITKVPGNLYVALFGHIPSDVCEQIERELDIGNIYMAGLASQGTPFGVVFLMLRKGDELGRVDLVEVYLRMAMLALRSRFAEEGKKADIPHKHTQGQPVLS
jgi:PAS domain S-box-containing protein